MMKINSWRQKRVKAYKYFLSLGPSRSLRDVSNAGYAEYRALLAWSAKHKWYDLARDYDRKSMLVLQDTNPDFMDLMRQILIKGTSTVFFDAFQLQPDGSVKFQGNWKNWKPHDWLAWGEFLDNLTGFMGANRKQGIDVNLNLHVAIMSMIDKLQHRGYNPFTISHSDIEKGLPPPNGKHAGTNGNGA